MSALLGHMKIVSLALNLPGPAALMRCVSRGARCVKFEPPSGDPMKLHAPAAYETLHEGVAVIVTDLKEPPGQQALHDQLQGADVLLTSFRPSTFAKLGIEWASLQARHPRLSHVAIVGAPGERANEPGHDLTYMADNGLVEGLYLPSTLYADMGGSLAAAEAIVAAAFSARSPGGEGSFVEVALSDVAAWLALPRDWQLTGPLGLAGGAHAGYRVYACKDGRVAVAALEPAFAKSLSAAAGLQHSDLAAMFLPQTREQLAQWLLGKTRSELDALSASADIPLHTMSA